MDAFTDTNVLQIVYIAVKYLKRANQLKFVCTVQQSSTIALGLAQQGLRLCIYTETESYQAAGQSFVTLFKSYLCGEAETSMNYNDKR